MPPVTGCAALQNAGLIPHHRDTPAEEDVSSALADCRTEIQAGQDDKTYWNGPGEGVERVKIALARVEKAKQRAAADPDLAEQTWPFPWNQAADHDPIQVRAGLARCDRELPPLLAKWQQQVDDYRAEKKARRDRTKADFEAAVASVGPRRKLVLKLHGLPRQYDEDEGWKAADRWSYAFQRGDTVNGFYTCQVSYFFQDEELVASNANPPHCANIINP